MRLFCFFFHPSPSAPRHRSPRVGAGRTAAYRAPGGGAPHKGWGSGGLRRGAGQREEGWGARGAGHFILWAQSCPHISARSLLLPLPRILAPQPRGQHGGDGAAPPGGMGRKRRDGADPQQHNKVPTWPRWCWRRWVGDRQGSSLAPGTTGGMGTRLGPPQGCSGEGSVPRPPGMRDGEGHQPGGTELGPSVLFLKGLLLGDERPEGAIPEAGADAEA